MDALQAILAKRDTRQYLPDPVGDDDLRRILQAGRMAGSAKNNQATRVVVVDDAADRQALADCGDFTSWIGSAPVVLVLCMPTEVGRLFDLGRVAQNIMVAAHALGLATCPVTFHHQDRLRPLLGLPDDHEGPMGITLGHPAPPDPNRPSAPRLPLEQFAYRGHWGQ